MSQIWYPGDDSCVRRVSVHDGGGVKMVVSATTVMVMTWINDDGDEAVDKEEVGEDDSTAVLEVDSDMVSQILAGMNWPLIGLLL